MKEMPASQNALNDPNAERIKPEGDPKFEAMLKEAFTKKNLKMKSELRADQMVDFARAYQFDKYFPKTGMKQFADTMLELLISKGRQGRKELSEMAKTLGMDQQADNTLASRLFGMK